jgi:hypothetical protein
LLPEDPRRLDRASLLAAFERGVEAEDDLAAAWGYSTPQEPDELPASWRGIDDTLRELAEMHAPPQPVGNIEAAGIDLVGF